MGYTRLLRILIDGSVPNCSALITDLSVDLKLDAMKQQTLEL